MLAYTSRYRHELMPHNYYCNFLLVHVATDVPMTQHTLIPDENQTDIYEIPTGV